MFVSCFKDLMTTGMLYPPTPAAQGGARKGKGFSDTALVAIFSVLYPPTPTSTTTTITTTTTTTTTTPVEASGQ